MAQEELRPRTATCYDRMQAAFAVGLVVGVTVGGIFGTPSAIKQGLKNQELVRAIGKSMLQMGGTFGAFMSIGVALRCF